MLGARSGATASNAKIENSTERCLGISEKDNKILTDFLGRSVTIGTVGDICNQQSFFGVPHRNPEVHVDKNQNCRHKSARTHDLRAFGHTP
jgi:hypothetical protein